MKEIREHVLNANGKPIIVRHRKVGTSYILTVPKVVESFVPVTDKYRLEILADGSLMYRPIIRDSGPELSQ